MSKTKRRGKREVSLNKIDELEALFSRLGLEGTGAGYRFCSANCLGAVRPFNASSSTERHCTSLASCHKGEKVYVGSTTCERGV